MNLNRFFLTTSSILFFYSLSRRIKFFYSKRGEGLILGHVEFKAIRKMENQMTKIEFFWCRRRSPMKIVTGSEVGEEEIGDILVPFMKGQEEGAWSSLSWGTERIHASLKKIGDLKISIG